MKKKKKITKNMKTRRVEGEGRRILNKIVYKMYNSLPSSSSSLFYFLFIIWMELIRCVIVCIRLIDIFIMFFRKGGNLCFL